MFYLRTHSTHFSYGYMEGRNEMVYLTMHWHILVMVIWKEGIKWFI